MITWHKINVTFYNDLWENTSCSTTICTCKEEQFITRSCVYYISYPYPLRSEISWRWLVRIAAAYKNVGYRNTSSREVLTQIMPLERGYTRFERDQDAITNLTLLMTLSFTCGDFYTFEFLRRTYSFTSGANILYRITGLASFSRHSYDRNPIKRK